MHLHRALRHDRLGSVLQHGDLPTIASRSDRPTTAAIADANAAAGLSMSGGLDNDLVHRRFRETRRLTIWDHVLPPPRRP